LGCSSSWTRLEFDLSLKIAVLGCTLFSNVLSSQTESVSFGLNDFYHNKAYTANLEGLNAQVKSITEAECDRSIIIFTHYSPTISPEDIDPAHAQSKISSGFSIDLSDELCWTSRIVKVWAFSHTHFNCDFEDSTGKRVLANQRGYSFRQAAGFDASMCIEMGDLRKCDGHIS
jgi:hypothetical protein